MSIAYEGYELKATSYYLPTKKTWDSKVTIIKLQDKDGNIHTHNAISRNTFSSQEEAINNAYTLGKEIIDGKHPNTKISF